MIFTVPLGRGPPPLPPSHAPAEDTPRPSTSIPDAKPKIIPRAARYSRSSRSTCGDSTDEASTSRHPETDEASIAKKEESIAEEESIEEEEPLTEEEPRDAVSRSPVKIVPKHSSGHRSALTLTLTLTHSPTLTLTCHSLSHSQSHSLKLRLSLTLTLSLSLSHSLTHSLLHHHRHRHHDPHLHHHHPLDPNASRSLDFLLIDRTHTHTVWGLSPVF